MCGTRLPHSGVLVLCYCQLLFLTAPLFLFSTICPVSLTSPFSHPAPKPTSQLLYSTRHNDPLNPRSAACPKRRSPPLEGFPYTDFIPGMPLLHLIDCGVNVYLFIRRALSHPSFDTPSTSGYNPNCRNFAIRSTPRRRHYANSSNTGTKFQMAHTAARSKNTREISQKPMRCLVGS